TLVDYSVGLALAKNDKPSTRKALVSISVIVNIGLLGFFKYYDFFLDTFVNSFSVLGMSFEADRLNVILPVGISFYTFQTLSYTIDVYRNKIAPTRDLLSFMAFVSFFPQLVAGPIERATTLLPQILKKRKFDTDQAIIGVKQIIWGLFKKIVIADNCAQYVDEIFSNYQDLSSTTLALGAFYFAFQIYGDFSGYSDIAIGTARLFNIRLMTNFRYPYFSRNLVEFWRRWHISLSTWFRDYVYIPLGGNKRSVLRHIVNLFVVFLVSGLWHGANWTFVFWGAFHGLLYCLVVFFGSKMPVTKTIAETSFFPSAREIIAVGTTFIVVLLGWVFFRAPSIEIAFDYLGHMFQFEYGMTMLHIGRYPFEMLPLVALLLYTEWLARHIEFPLYSNKFSILKVGFFIAMIMIFGSFSNMQDFIYFQF
ncbi:MAG: MBOAT family O-acyltransferase, partial [Marinirhabdus sp.]|nr:MBOAT family O-acyltransferase [Marinirhabdus sp.]